MRTPVQVNVSAKAVRSRFTNWATTSRTAVIVIASIGGIKASDPPKVQSASASAYAISTAAIANDVKICNLVY